MTNKYLVVWRATPPTISHKLMAIPARGVNAPEFVSHIAQPDTTPASLTFTSKDSSFVQFSPNWLPSSPQGISFKFKTLDADALLFLHYFANKTQDKPSYLFWLELKQGKLLASHLLDENVETFSLNNKLNDDEWHTVNYTKKPMEGDLSISVDATTVGLSVYQGDAVSDWLQSLQSVSAVFIAGLSPSSEAALSKDFRHLTGCVEDILFLSANDEEPWKEIHGNLQEGTLPGCVDRCALDMPCMNGRCVNSYESVHCDCIGTGYHGSKCEIRGNAVVSFQGFNFLEVTMFSSKEKLPMDTSHINLSFKVGIEQVVGMLFYAVGAVPVQTYLAMFIQNGRLVVNVKLGSRENRFLFKNNQPINDDSWHSVSFIHFDKHIVVELDGQRYEQAVLDGDGSFHFDGKALIGGGENMNGFPGLDKSANLVGCLREVYIDRFNVLEALAMNTSGLSFVGGDPIFQCQHLGYPPITFPSHESTLTLDGWKNGSMDLMFDLKTAQGDGLVMLVLLDVDKKLEGRLRMELMKTALVVHVDVGTAPGQQLVRKTLTSSSGINDTRWHGVALHLRDGVCTFVVDGIGFTLKYSDELSASTSVYLGGGWRGQGTGVKGCVRHIVFQGQEVIATHLINTAAANGVLLDNCPLSNPCAAGEFVCLHGGTCNAITGGAKCNCEGTNYVGAMCSYSMYKRSCAEHYFSGDHESGVKMVDLDGQGPLSATYVNCSFSSGSVITSVEHNFAAKTLVRDVHQSSVQFNITYHSMANEQLAQLVMNSPRCRQYFSYWCFEAPLYIKKGWTVLQSPSGRRLRNYNLLFASSCDANEKEWNVDHGYITNKDSLPIVSLQFYKMPSVAGVEETTKGTLSLGPLQCSSEFKEYRGHTATISRSQDFITLEPWNSNSLYFKFRTSGENVVMFHQTSKQKSLTAIIENAFNLRITFEMNGEFYESKVTTDRPMNDGQWHTMTVEKSLIDFRITVDYNEGFLALPKGLLIQAFTGPFLLGGMEEPPIGTEGMTGCVTEFTYNGGIAFLYDYYEHDENLQIYAGCNSACHSNPCQNDGRCVDHWSSYTCICAHPAQTGKDCSKDNTKDVVSFMREDLFLEYEPDNTDILTSNLSLGFRTIQSQALILYATDYYNNFIQMELVNETTFVFQFNSGRDVYQVKVNSTESLCPAVVMDEQVLCTHYCKDDTQCNIGMKCCPFGCGTQCVIPNAGSPLNNGEWVEVSVERYQHSTVVTVNDRKEQLQVPVSLLSDVYAEPFLHPQEVVQPYHLRNQGGSSIVQTFVGGAPNTMTLLPGLKGCLRGLVVNGQPWALQDLVKIMQRLFSSKAPSLKCMNHCSENPCKNGGVCTELWVGFTCNCTGTSYSGQTCQEEYGAQFKDESMLSIPLMMKTDPPALQMQQDSLEFGFSTDQPSGVLFYVRNIESSQVEERILILLDGGDLEAHIDLGAGSTMLRVLGPFNDTFRHVVVFKRFGNRVLFDVDNIGYEYETLEPVEETEFNDRHVMVVGGVETNMTSYGLDGLHGYTGCLTGLTYNGKHPLETLFRSNPEEDQSNTVHRQQCQMFQVKEDITKAITPVIPTQPIMMRTMPPWNSQAVQGVEISLPAELVSSSKINWILIGAVAGGGVAVLLLLLCCCCILRNSKKENVVMEEKQHLVKPQDEIHVVHAVRQEAAEAQCMDAPPPEETQRTPPHGIPEYVTPVHGTQTSSQVSMQQEKQEVKHTPLMESLIADKIASADSLSDDAAFRQLEAEAAAPSNDTPLWDDSTSQSNVMPATNDTVFPDIKMELENTSSGAVQSVDPIPIMSENEEALFDLVALADSTENTAPHPTKSDSEETSV
ncbi:axotactin-like [Asterias amurensis]|uniref:axotactin-like n=1 Tax=Asterias amurensis TaxID=7602 RepID=UPI003AB20133